MTFIYLKDKYTYKEIVNKGSMTDLEIEDVAEEISSVEEFYHFPDKDESIRNSYNLISADNKVTDKYILGVVRKESSSLSKSDKEIVLKYTIQCSFKDGIVTDKEYEFIKQLEHALNLEGYAEKFVISNKLKKNSTKLAIAAGIFFIGVISLYQIYQNSSVNVFTDDKFIFNQIDFNRYIVYGNVYKRGANEYFRKQAIIYIKGTANVSIKTPNLKHSKEIVEYRYTENPFDIDIKGDPGDIFLVDELIPQPISESDAKKAAAVIGIVGGYAGAKAGASVGSIVKTLPFGNMMIAKFSEIAGGVLGSIAGGGVAYTLTYNGLKGLKLSNRITQTEIDIVISDGLKAIKESLIENKEIEELSKMNLKNMLMMKYKNSGLNIKDVVFNKI